MLRTTRRIATWAAVVSIALLGPTVPASAQATSAAPAAAPTTAATPAPLMVEASGTAPVKVELKKNQCDPDKSLLCVVSKKPTLGKLAAGEPPNLFVYTADKAVDSTMQDSATITINDQDKGTTTDVAVKITLKPAPPKPLMIEASGTKPAQVELKKDQCDPDKSMLCVVSKKPTLGKLAAGDMPNLFVYTADEAVDSAKQDSATITSIDQNTGKQSAVPVKISLKPAAPGKEKTETASSESGQVKKAIGNIGKGFTPEELNSVSLCAFEEMKDNKGIFQHACTPSWVEVSATRASTVTIQVPPGAKRIEVTAGEQWETKSLNVDRIEFGDDCPAPEFINVQLYRNRRASPSYLSDGKLTNLFSPFSRTSTGQGGDDGPTMDKGGFFRPLVRAEYYLRGNRSQMAPMGDTAASEADGTSRSCPAVLSLLLSGKSSHLVINRWSGENGEVATTDQVELRYYRWLVDAGGFYGVRWTGDDELVTQTVTDKDGKNAKTAVLRVEDPETTSSSGLMLHFFRRNYPSLGLAVGFAFPDGRAPSYFLGGSFRLLNLGPNAVATLSAGYTHTEVRRFPEIKPIPAGTNLAQIDDPTKLETGLYDPNDPLLKGTNDYVTEPFVSITLAFELPTKPK